MGRARELANLFSGGSADINVKTSDGGILNLQTSDTTVTQDSVVGSIQFQAPDEASGTDAILVASKIEAVAEGTFSASSNATSLVFSTASSAAAGTVSGKMTFTSGGNLIIKDTDTADGSSPVITLQTGDTDIAQDDVLGSINFQAPDEGTGTDAILVAAGISAVSEGDFSSSSNATKLVFKTGSSEAASEKMSLSSAGILTVSDDIIIGDGKTIGSSSDPDAISIGSDGDVTLTQDLELQHDGAILSFGANDEITLTHSHNSGLLLKNTNTGDDNPAILILQTGDTDIAQNDALGKLQFQAPDEGTGTDAILVAASIEAFSEGDFSSSNNATTLEFSTGRSAAAGSDGGRLRLNSSGRLSLKNQNTADDSFPVIALETGDTDIAQDDVLGRIVFSSPDEGTGTDAILVAAAIEAVSEGDFAADSNATELSFKTGASAAAVRRMTISSTGETTISRAGSRTDHGGLLRLNGTYASTNNGPNIMFHGTATSAHPSMQILNYSHNDQSINFDSYYNTSGNWISSDSNGNYQLVKRSDKMIMNRKSGVSAGSGITWVEMQHAVLDNGQMTFTANVNTVSHYMKNIHGSSPYGVYIQFSASPDNNDNYFLRCIDGSATRATIFSDGDVNTSDAGTLSSDSKNKNTITDATSKYDDVKKLKVRNFYWNEDYHPAKKDKKLIGFIAQELETVFPGLVSEMKDMAPIEVDNLDDPLTFYEDGDTIPSGKKIGDPKTYGKKQEEKDLGTTTKVIREGKLIPILTKALQECMVKIETLETSNADLISRVKTLEDA